MKLFGKEIVTGNYYVAEVVDGQEIRVTGNFPFKADADTAASRMKDGVYVVKTA